MDNVCSVCGKPLTQFGNKDLKDGILCRDCVALCSEWLSDDDYKLSTVEDIKKHLEYRKDNKDKLNTFNSKKIIDSKYDLYVGDNGEFVISKKKDIVKDNSDILNVKDIDSYCVYEEKYEDTDKVDVYFKLNMNHKYLNNICFRINEFVGIDRNSDEYKDAVNVGLEFIKELKRGKHHE